MGVRLWQDEGVSVPRAARKNGLRRRDDLLDAALRCFAERGILSTGIEDVRKAAGASPSSVYHLFGGLPQIVVALLARTFERMLAHLAARVMETKRLEAAVRALVDAHLEWVVAHRDEARFMYQAIALEIDAEDRAELLELKRTLKQPIFEHLARLGARDLPGWSSTQIELVLLGPSHEACRRWLAGGDVDPAWMRATLPELAWRSIAGVAPASVPPRQARPRAKPSPVADPSR